MIDTKTEELAALYVLDLLSEEELTSFEQRLETEDDVKQLVRELSGGLHAPLKGFNGPERMDLLGNIQEKIGIPSETLSPSMDSQSQQPKGKIIPVRWIQTLSVAATLLLALNLVQFFSSGSELTGVEDELEKVRASEQALMEENETIKAFNKSWESEYMNLAERMLPFVESRDGLGQFTVIDLLDVKETGGNGAVEGDISEYFLSRSPLKFTSVKLPDIPESSDTITIGYTVWKEDENRGYIDLYNLGEAGAGRAPFLWLKASSGEPYVPVGYLPFLDRGTGTFYFTVDREKFVPTSVLISEESVDGPGIQPSPYKMMIGP